MGEFSTQHEIKNVKWPLLIAGAALAAACTTNGSSEKAANTSSSPEDNKCNFASGPQVSKDQAVWGLAGVIRFANGRTVGRPIYLEEGKKLGELVSKGESVGKFAVTNIVDVSLVTKYVHPSLETPRQRQSKLYLNDATCSPGKEKRPADDAQLLTLTGTVKLDGTVSESTFASFNDDQRHATTLAQAFAAGAVSIWLEQVPEGYVKER